MLQAWNDRKTFHTINGYQAPTLGPWNAKTAQVVKRCGQSCRVQRVPNVLQRSGGKTVNLKRGKWCKWARLGWVTCEAIENGGDCGKPKPTAQLTKAAAVWLQLSFPRGSWRPGLLGLGEFLKENQKVRFWHEASQVSKCCSGGIQPTGHEFVSPALVRQLFPFSLPALRSPTWLSGNPEDVDLSQMGLSQETTPLPHWPGTHPPQNRQGLSLGQDDGPGSLLWGEVPPKGFLTDCLLTSQQGMPVRQACTCLKPTETQAAEAFLDLTIKTRFITLTSDTLTGRLSLTFQPMMLLLTLVSAAPHSHLLPLPHFTPNFQTEGTCCPSSLDLCKWCSLDHEDLLEEGMATHSSFLTWRIPMDRWAWEVTVHGVGKGRIGLSD